MGSHDTTRIRTLVGEDPRQVDVAAGLLFTMPGIPMLTYGDEIGMRGDFAEDGRRADAPGTKAVGRASAGVLPWTHRSTAGSTALREGGIRWVYADGDALVFLRETPMSGRWCTRPRLPRPGDPQHPEPAGHRGRDPPQRPTAATRR